MRCSVGIVDGQLTFDNLYRTACAPFALILPIVAPLAIYHQELWLCLGDIRSVTQFEPFLGGRWFVSLFSDRNVLAIR